MKTFFTILFSTIHFCLNSQVLCTGGGSPSIVSFPIGGQSSFDFFDEAVNYNTTMISGIVGDVVAAELVNVNLTTVGDSWCSDARITIADEAGLATSNFVDLTLSGDDNGSPCSDLPISLLVPLTGIVFPTGSAGELYFELWESFDDNPGAIDATYSAGSSVNVYVCPTGQVLPIKLESFEARSKDEVNQISWSTSSEKNSNYHAVMRSRDGKNDWIEIAKVYSSNSSSTIIYTINDEKPLSTSYYQLKSVDYDGTFALSQVVVVDNNRKSGLDNLAQINRLSGDHWEITLGSQEDDILLVRIFDLSGKIIHTSSQVMIQGQNQFTFNPEIKATGIYFIELRSKMIDHRQKIAHIAD
jgi:hypothetical protein